MNGEYLYDAMGGISPLHVHEAEAVRFSPSVWRRLLPAAACLAVLIGMYSGFRSLLYGTPGMETVVPAAQAAAEPLAQISLFHWGSLLLGLIAWGLPCAALVRRQHQKSLTLSSFIACILSLLLLVYGVLDRVNRGEFTALEDTMGKILAAAVVLVVGTAVMNAAAHCRDRLRTTIRWISERWLCIVLSLIAAIISSTLACYGLDIQSLQMNRSIEFFPGDDAAMVFHLGFTFVTFVFILFLTLVYRRRPKKTGLVFFILQWVLTIIAFRLLIESLTAPDVHYYEVTRNTLLLVFCGEVWALSILCMGFGIWRLLNAAHPRNEEKAE